jgi:WhiB family redox-sensing transcriptional regulator
MFDTTDAACNEDIWKMFFPEDPHTYEQDVNAAKEICASCPVAIQCLAFALKEEQYGIWGGTTHNERKRMHYTKKRLYINIANK